MIVGVTNSVIGFNNITCLQEWLLDSEGINLMKVMAQEHVDSERTISNHVVEMFECLGIEAARLSILKELRAVLEFDGSKVNYRCAHVETLPTTRKLVLCCNNPVVVVSAVHVESNERSQMFPSTLQTRVLSIDQRSNY